MKYRKLAIFFAIVGMNPIFIYLFSNLGETSSDRDGGAIYFKAVRMERRDSNKCGYNNCCGSNGMVYLLFPLQAQDLYKTLEGFMLYAPCPEP